MSNASLLAGLLHPSYQKMIINNIVVLNEITKLYELKSAENKELAYFEAGSYIPVFVEIDGNLVERPYSICSSPKESIGGVYKIVVKKTNDGYVSNYIVDNWKIDDEVLLGSPKEAEVYNAIRDSRNVIALAGGVGITPFYSMAKAIIDKDNDFYLTVFYGANTYDELLFKEEWSKLEKESDGKIKVIPVIANEDVKNCEKGFISLDIVKKYVNVNDATVFISGPPAMVKAMKKMLEPLNLKRKSIRVSMNGDSGFNHSFESEEEYNLTIHMAGETFITKAKANETILVAIEKAGIKPAVYCRSGVCGFCRAMLVKGDFKLATEETGVRKMDKYFGFIHPCCSYPTSDLEIIVQRNK